MRTYFWGTWRVFSTATQTKLSHETCFNLVLFSGLKSSESKCIKSISWLSLLFYGIINFSKEFTFGDLSQTVINKMYSFSYLLSKHLMTLFWKLHSILKYFQVHKKFKQSTSLKGGLENAYNEVQRIWRFNATMKNQNTFMMTAFSQYYITVKFNITGNQKTEVCQ